MCRIEPSLKVSTACAFVEPVEFMTYICCFIILYMLWFRVGSDAMLAVGLLLNGLASGWKASLRDAAYGCPATLNSGLVELRFQPVCRQHGVITAKILSRPNATT